MTILNYDVNPHAYGRPNHAQDEAEVRQRVSQVFEWWHDSTSLSRTGNDLYAGLAGPLSGPIALVFYNATRNVVNDLYYTPTLVAAWATVNRKGYTKLIPSSPIP